MTFTIDPIHLITFGLVAVALVLWGVSEWLRRRYERRETLRRLPPVRRHVHRWIRAEEPVDGVYVEECLCEAMRFVTAEGA